MEPRAGTAAALRRSREVPAAFADVYRLLSEPVLVYLTRRTYDPEVALELTAETFARAFSARRRFRGATDAEAEGWIFAIARNLLGRWYRAGAIERRAVERLQLQLPRLEPDDYERIEELAELPALRAQLAAALESLSPDQREALRLRVVEELAYDQIAAQVGVPEQTVRARVSRGLRGLAAALAGDRI
ncbi:MAG TPA: sigma-70 family RNA polymerase sigma factor [Thermoleophilaceae bacterium]|nr:sigma-70 family RNA polymerase sigma factor [Thermoleophilaceae bacterium]